MTGLWHGVQVACVGGAMTYKAALFWTAAALGIAVALGGCSSSPESIIGDDAALCRFAADAGGADSYAQCRSRLAGRQQIMAAAGASRIEGYALLNTPAPATGVADQCKASDAPKNCGTGDITGTIKQTPPK
ncbi:MAG: hypothetical protein JSR72_22355 [Proteobacteria bacterium]|nr:hypothetical protein [Pseudomonadota bacterium]